MSLREDGLHVLVRVGGRARVRVTVTAPVRLAVGVAVPVGDSVRPYPYPSPDTLTQHPNFVSCMFWKLPKSCSRS